MVTSKKKNVQNSDTGFTIETSLIIKFLIFFGILICGYIVGRVYEHDKAMVDGKVYAEQQITKYCPLATVNQIEQKVNLTWNNTILS